MRSLISGGNFTLSGLTGVTRIENQAEEDGAVLFRDKGCSYCHGVAGTGGKKGPVLTNLRTDKQWPPEKITAQIMNGGQKMPPFSDSLSDGEIADLVAYLRAKHKPVPPPVAAQPAPPAN